MDINNIQRKYRKTGPKVNINIKVSDEVSKWLRENNYSPTAIFNEALKELGCPALSDAADPTEETSDINEDTEQILEIEKELGHDEPHPQSIEAAQLRGERKRAPVYTCECGYIDTENFVSCPKCEKIQKKDH